MKVNEKHGTILNLKEIPELGVQKTLQTAITNTKFTPLLQNLAPRPKTMLLDRVSKQWIPWVNLLCSGPLKQHLPGEEFRTAIKFQFGFKIRQGWEKCQECETIMDIFGEHGTK